MNTKAIIGMVAACLSIAAVVDASTPAPVKYRAHFQAPAGVNHEPSRGETYSPPRNPGVHHLIGS